MCVCGGGSPRFCFGKSKLTDIAGDRGAGASSNWRDTRAAEGAQDAVCDIRVALFVTVLEEA